MRQFILFFYNLMNLNYQPLEQFEIIIIEPIYLLFFNLFITNSLFYMFIILLLYFYIFFVGIYKISFIPTNIQYIIENLYMFVWNLIKEQTGSKGLEYFGFIFSLFIFILFSNVLGLFPFGFTVTSHILVTFTLSFSVIVGLTIIGFREQKVKFLNLFIPKDVSKIMVPLLVIIEVVSYISRAFSLAIRLFANLMSGHTLLNILSTFVIKLFNKNFFFGIIPFIVVLGICFLEICLAFLQAYVFMVLTCIYLNDSLHEASH